MVITAWAADLTLTRPTTCRCWVPIDLREAFHGLRIACIDTSRVGNEDVTAYAAVTAARHRYSFGISQSVATGSQVRLQRYMEALRHDPRRSDRLIASLLITNDDSLLDVVVDSDCGPLRDDDI